MATLVNMGAVFGQGMLILGVTRTAARLGPVNPTKGGWSKRSEITESQVAVFRGVANHALLLVRLVRRVMSANQPDRSSIPAQTVGEHVCSFSTGAFSPVRND